MCIARLQQGLGALTSVPTVEVAVLECRASEDGSEEPVPFELLDVDFFDSEVVVIVYRPQDQQSKCQGAPVRPSAHHDRRAGACIATVGYANLIYHTIPSHEYVNGTTRETLMGDVLGLLANGQVWVHCYGLAAPASRHGGVTEESLFIIIFYLDRLGSRTDHSVTAAERVHDGGRELGGEWTGRTAGGMRAGRSGADAGGTGHGRGGGGRGGGGGIGRVGRG